MMNKLCFKILLTSMLISLLLAVGGCSRNENGNQAEPHGHEHGDLPYEWSASFELSTCVYSLVFEESDQDPSILIAFFLADEEDRPALEHLAYHVMKDEVAVDVDAGEYFTIEDQHAYNLELKPEGTTFTLAIEEEGNYILFTEHFAWEFAMRIMDISGNEVTAKNPIDHMEPHEH